MSMAKEVKAGIIGTADAVLPFGALGFRVYVAENAEEGRIAVKQASEQGVGVLLVDETLAVGMANTLSELREAGWPIITVIPGLKGSLGTGLTLLKKRVEKAIGADILFKGEER
ncbi:MAG TPA: V-type ATP synthase subunit F [Clostridia bacterium]|nr:V-type ATP synthase subunit F [Clostridia bacterium]